MATQLFLAEPAEPVLFGPPQSFVAGEAHRLRSQFPPSPRTFQGMIRTRLLLGAKTGHDFEGPDAANKIKELVGTPAALPDGWQMRGPWPARRLMRGTDNVVEPWVPTPHFLRACGTATLHARRVVSDHLALGDLPGSPPALGRPERDDRGARGGWIGPANLRYALAGEASGCWCKTQWAETRPPFVKEEFQPGLAIDQTTGTAQQSLLYFAESLRFESSAGLLGELRAPGDQQALDGFQALGQGAGWAGRKRRLVRFSTVETLDPDWQFILDGRHLPDEVAEDDEFWLLAMTPVRLDEAAGPGRPRVPLPAGVSVEVRAALTGPALTVGGYELATRRPRANRPYMSAGSAWLIGLTGGDAVSRADALRMLHDSHLFGPAEEAAMGFGHVLVGIGPARSEATS